MKVGQMAVQVANGALQLHLKRTANHLQLAVVQVFDVKNVPMKSVMYTSLESLAVLSGR